jgi:hypothetical protein
VDVKDMENKGVDVFCGLRSWIPQSVICPIFIRSRDDLIPLKNQCGTILCCFIEFSLDWAN